MAQEMARIDIDAVPGLSTLVHDAAKSGRPRAIEQNGETVALLVPVTRRPHRRPRVTFVDTSHLPPVGYQTLDELIQDIEPSTEAFDWESIKETLDRDRATAWRS